MTEVSSCSIVGLVILTEIAESITVPKNKRKSCCIEKVDINVQLIEHRQ